MHPCCMCVMCVGADGSSRFPGADAESSCLCGKQTGPRSMSRLVTETVLAEFEAHAARLKAASRSRKSAMEYRNVVEDDEEREALNDNVVDTLGKCQPLDVVRCAQPLQTPQVRVKGCM